MRWSGQSIGPKLGTRVFLILVRLLGYWPAYILLPGVSLFFSRSAVLPRKALQEFRQHLGLSSNWFFLWGHFFSYALSYLHRMGFFIRGTRGLSLHTVGEERIAELTKERGVILLSAHIGSWELGGNLLVSRIDTPVNVLMADRDRGNLQEIDEVLTQQRQVRIISIDQDPLAITMAIREALQRCEIVAVLGDRYVEGVATVAVDFLGQSAQFPRGIFDIALLEHVPIVPVFTLRTGLEKYTFMAKEPILLEPKSRAERSAVVTEAVEKYVREVEKIAREYPEQWYNFYPFWG